MNCDVNCNVNYCKIENKSVHNKQSPEVNLEPVNNNVNEENLDSEAYINKLLNLYN